MSRRMLAISSSNHRQRSGGNVADGHAIPGSGLLLTTWQTPTLGFRKQERQLRTGSTGGCLRSIAQRTRSGACSYWIGQWTMVPLILTNRTLSCIVDKYQNNTVTDSDRLVNRYDQKNILYLTLGICWQKCGQSLVVGLLYTAQQ